MKNLLLTIAATLSMTALTMAQNVPNHVPTAQNFLPEKSHSKISSNIHVEDNNYFCENLGQIKDQYRQARPDILLITKNNFK